MRKPQHGSHTHVTIGEISPLHHCANLKSALNTSTNTLVGTHIASLTILLLILADIS